MRETKIAILILKSQIVFFPLLGHKTIKFQFSFNNNYLFFYTLMKLQRTKKIVVKINDRWIKLNKIEKK